MGCKSGLPKLVTNQIYQKVTTPIVTSEGLPKEKK